VIGHPSVLASFSSEGSQYLFVDDVLPPHPLSALHHCRLPHEFFEVGPPIPTAESFASSVKVVFFFFFFLESKISDPPAQWIAFPPEMDSGDFATKLCVW